MATFFSNYIDYNKAFNDTKRPIIVINDKRILDHNAAAADLLELGEGDYLVGRPLDEVIIRAYSEYSVGTGSMDSMLELAREEGHNQVYAFCKTAINRIQCFHMRITPFEMIDEKPVYFTVWGQVDMDKAEVETGNTLPGYTIESYTHLAIKDLISKNSNLKSELIRVGNIESLFEVAQRNFQEILDIGKMGLWRYDSISNLLHLPPGTCQLLGITFKDEQGVKMTLEEYFKKYVILEDKAVFLNSCQEMQELKEDDTARHTLQYRIRNDKGKLMNLLSRSVCHNDPKGQLISCSGVFQDVTEIWEKNIELTKYQGALINAEVDISWPSQDEGLYFWEFDLASGYLDLAPSIFRKITGHPGAYKGRILLKDLRSLLKRGTRAQVGQLEKLVTRLNSETEIGHFLVSPDHDTKFRFTFKTFLDDKGEPYKYYGTVQDIGELRRSENEKNRLSKIIEATPDLVIIFDKNEKPIYLNKTASAFFTHDKTQESGTSAPKIDSTALRQALREGIWSGESTLSVPGKAKMAVSQVVIPHHDEQGRLEFVSVIYRDITHLKQIEKSLKQKNNELDNFVYKVSHDLRGPIASLLGLYNVAIMELKDKEALRYLELYNQQILRLNNIVLSLIDLTRIKEQAMKKEKIDFASLTDECVDSLKYIQDPEALKVIKSIKLEFPVYSDHNLWNTILQNLLENAIKYARPGIPSYVNVDVQTTRDNQLLVGVSDNGVGIDPQFHDQIYDMFFRANEGVSGSGLGLYIVKSAVEKMNGSISFSSRRNEGTTFKIIVPIDGAPVESAISS